MQELILKARSPRVLQGGTVKDLLKRIADKEAEIERSESRLPFFFFSMAKVTNSAGFHKRSF